ncbi:hypothetical protein HMPREF2760_01795 [Corynebacterium sp. HMSC065D07]|uniref:hypothetical protein n=1 Tax=Corynebacterium sp. HMSC065D07 TaxID=1739264 RepID=UPI0008A2CFAD|nr:hypothetical protein [Corynebacterium sp. HMSC065D07]OFL62272.1 hypothetical protein HMPREF2760_01795 [Corynebacterium sp. HMSC065D07]
MVNIQYSADERLFRDLLPHLTDWLQAGYDTYISSACVFPSKNRKDGSGLARTIMLKDCLLENEVTEIGPAILELEKARSSLSMSISLKAHGTTILLRSDKTFDKSLNHPLPSTQSLGKEKRQFALFADVDVIPMATKTPSKFAVITWAWRKVPADNEAGHEIRWDLKMYFSEYGDSVATARFKYGFKTSSVAGKSLAQIESFIPTDDELQFIANENAEEGTTS